MSAPWCYGCGRTWCNCADEEAVEAARLHWEERQREMEAWQAEAAAMGLDAQGRPIDPPLDENLARERLAELEQARHDMARHGKDY